MKMVTTRAVFKKSNLIITAFVLAVSSMAATVPFILSKRAAAVGSSEVVYDAVPSVVPQTNYPSLGYQATSTSELADAIELGGSNRLLDDVTITMSNWAKYSDYSTNPTYSGNPASWSQQITLNVYSAELDVNGEPATLLATKTQSFDIPWRPESDPNCASTSNGTGWKVGETCYNFSGIATNITFDLSSLGVVLPEDIIVGVTYNTQSYGTAPTGTAGPYNSLNVAFPSNQVVTVGADADVDSLFWDTTYPGYTAGLKKDTGWAPNGTVAIKVTAEPAVLATPANLRLNGDKPCGYATNVNFISPTWDAVPGALSYNYQVTLPNGATYGPTNVGNVTSVSGAFGGQGLSTFSVQAVGVNGLLSDWAPACAVTYDATAPGVPTLESPANGVLQNVNDFYFNWSDVSGASGYEIQASQSAAVDGNGSLVNGVWKGDYLQNQPIVSEARSVGASGTWYWQVRAVDAAGNKSSWTSPWSVTIDTVAPDAPVLSARAPGGTEFVSGGSTNSYEVVADWNDVAGASSYVYKYWNSIPGNPYTASAPYTVNGLGSSQTSGVFNQGEGTHFMQVFAVDVAGNISQGSNVFEITYDTTAPQVLGDTYETTGNVISPNFTASETPASFIWEWVSGPSNTGVTVSDSTALNPEFTVTTDGDYVYRITATDAAGNQASKLFSFAYVTPAPQPSTPTTEQPEVLGTDTEADGPSTPVEPEVTSFANTPTIVSPGFSRVAILGDEVEPTVNEEGSTPEVEGLSTLNSPAQAVNSDENQGRFLGIAWYWWLLMLAALALIGWWIAAAVRKRQAE